MARRQFTSHPLVVRRVHVHRIEEVTPRMRRIVVGGEGLSPAIIDGFPQPGFTAPGFDDHLKLIFATDGDVTAVLPQQREHGIEWIPSDTRVTRDYTPRHVDHDAQEITLDFVRHGAGPAATWAERAQVGDELCFVGPKSSVRLPEHVKWMLLIADETGLPAIGRFLDERPIHAPVHLVLFIEHESARQELPLRVGDTITWHTAAGGDAAAIEKAVREVAIPAGDGYAWAAAESRALLPVRRYLQREVGLPKDRVDITGYWHREDTEEAVAEVPAIPSPVPWLVTRAAVQLGLIDALADEGLGLDELAERLDISSDRIVGMLPLLAAYDVIINEGGFLRLGSIGIELLDDHEREELTGIGAELMLSLIHLAPALQQRLSSWQSATGRSLATQADDDPAVAEYLVQESDQLSFLLDGLVRDPIWAKVATCLVAGPGSTALIGAFKDARMSIPVSVFEDAHILTALRDAVEHPEALRWEPAVSDVAVLSLSLSYRTDDEALTLLRRVADFTGRAIVIDRARPDGLGPRATEEHALSLARTGSAHRDRNALARLFGASGWRSERIIELGWGVEATVIEKVATKAGKP